MQLAEVAAYAAQKGVVLKGDLPIGIDHDSVDAWYTLLYSKYSILLYAVCDTFGAKQAYAASLLDAQDDIPHMLLILSQITWILPQRILMVSHVTCC